MQVYKPSSKVNSNDVKSALDFYWIFGIISWWDDNPILNVHFDSTNQGLILTDPDFTSLKLESPLNLFTEHYTLLLTSYDSSVSVFYTGGGAPNNITINKELNEGNDVFFDLKITKTSIGG